jgi:hypothetical protein
MTRRVSDEQLEGEIDRARKHPEWYASRNIDELLDLQEARQQLRERDELIEQMKLGPFWNENTRLRHELTVALSRYDSAVLESQRVEKRNVGEIERLRSELTAEQEACDKDRANFKAIIDDVFEGIECPPECDSYGHVDDCPNQYGQAAFKVLRGRLKSELEAHAATKAQLEELQDAISPSRKGMVKPEYYVGVANRMRDREARILPMASAEQAEQIAALTRERDALNNKQFTLSS